MSADQRSFENIAARLAEVEARLAARQGMQSLAQEGVDVSTMGDIDLVSLWRIAWARRMEIAIITMVMSIGAVLYARQLPNIYSASASVFAANGASGGSGGLSKLASSYGGVASLAGIELPSGGGNRMDQVLELMKSWAFLDRFITERGLKPVIMATKSWDKASNKLVYDTTRYDPVKNKWIGDADENGSPEPSSFDTYERFAGMINLAYDKKTGILKISVEHYSPAVAAELASGLVKAVNRYFQSQDVARSQNNIDYLNQKVKSTDVADLQAAFYRLIESETRTLMLAQVGDEYLLETIVPAMAPEKKTRPKRSSICILGLFAGLMIGSAYALAANFVARKRSSS